MIYGSIILKVVVPAESCASSSLVVPSVIVFRKFRGCRGSIGDPNNVREMSRRAISTRARAHFSSTHHPRNAEFPKRHFPTRSQSCLSLVHRFSIHLGNTSRYAVVDNEWITLKITRLAYSRIYTRPRVAVHRSRAFAVFTPANGLRRKQIAFRSPPVRLECTLGRRSKATGTHSRFSKTAESWNRELSKWKDGASGLASVERRLFTGKLRVSIKRACSSLLDAVPAVNFETRTPGESDSGFRNDGASITTTTDRTM